MHWSRSKAALGPSPVVAKRGALTRTTKPPILGLKHRGMELQISIHHCRAAQARFHGCGKRSTVRLPQLRPGTCVLDVGGVFGGPARVFDTVRVFHRVEDAHAEHRKHTQGRNCQAFPKGKPQAGRSGQEGVYPVPPGYCRAEAPGCAARTPGRAACTQRSCSTASRVRRCGDEIRAICGEGAALTAQPSRSFRNGSWEVGGSQRSIDLQLGAGTGSPARRAACEVGSAPRDREAGSCGKAGEIEFRSRLDQTQDLGACRT